MKQTQGIFNQHSTKQYFRGVDFHLAVLSHEKMIMNMIPSIVKDGQLKQLKDISESI